jgi:hypothetical protein
MTAPPYQPGLQEPESLEGLTAEYELLKVHPTYLVSQVLSCELHLACPSLGTLAQRLALVHW